MRSSAQVLTKLLLPRAIITKEKKELTDLYEILVQRIPRIAKSKKTSVSVKAGILGMLMHLSPDEVKRILETSDVKVIIHLKTALLDPLVKAGKLEALKPALLSSHALSLYKKSNYFARFVAFCTQLIAIDKLTSEHINIFTQDETLREESEEIIASIIGMLMHLSPKEVKSILDASDGDVITKFKAMLLDKVAEAGQLEQVKERLLSPEALSLYNQDCHFTGFATFCTRLIAINQLTSQHIDLFLQEERLRSAQESIQVAMADLLMYLSPDAVRSIYQVSGVYVATNLKAELLDTLAKAGILEQVKGCLLSPVALPLYQQPEYFTNFTRFCSQLMAIKKLTDQHLYLYLQDVASLPNSEHLVKGLDILRENNLHELDAHIYLLMAFPSKAVSLARLLCDHMPVGMEKSEYCNLVYHYYSSLKARDETEDLSSSESDDEEEYETFDELDEDDACAGFRSHLSDYLREKEKMKVDVEWERQRKQMDEAWKQERMKMAEPLEKISMEYYAKMLTMQNEDNPSAASAPTPKPW